MVKGISLVLMIMYTSTTQTWAKDSAWSQQKKPIRGEAESIGFYTNGCVIGASTLPPKGPGYESIRRHRNRYYGHPELVQFIQSFSKEIQTEGLGPILVGDMSQPGGGPMAFGHRSHQSGLDADFWFTRPNATNRAEDAAFASMVDDNTEQINAKVWSKRQRRYIEIAAKNPKVARVLVNWIIKKALCAEVKGDRSWLRKVRPWWGHDRHFHVRLKCPSESKHCKEQRAIPIEDDCGRERWFSRASVVSRQKAQKKKGKQKPKPRKKKTIPRRCRQLLSR